MVRYYYYYLGVGAVGRGGGWQNWKSFCVYIHCSQSFQCFNELTKRVWNESGDLKIFKKISKRGGGRQNMCFQESMLMLQVTSDNLLVIFILRVIIDFIENDK